MDSPATRPFGKKEELVPCTRRHILLVFLAVFIFYMGVGGVLVYWAEFWRGEGIFLSEKVLLAQRGKPAHLENLGFLYPPLPALLLYPFVAISKDLAAPFLSSLAGGALAAVAFLTLKGAGVSRALALVFVMAIALNPLSLYTFSTGNTVSLYVLGVAIALYALTSYYLKRYTFFLAVAAVSLGVLILIRYETVITLLALLPFAPLLSHERGERTLAKHKLVAVALVLFSPAFFATIAWLYLNWLFKGDPHYFLRNFSVNFQVLEAMLGYQNEVAALSGDILRSMGHVLIALSWTFPAFLFILFVLLFRSWRPFIVFIFALPALVDVVILFLGLTAFPLSSGVLSIPLTALAYSFVVRLRPHPHALIRIGVAALLLLSLPLGYWRMYVSASDEERAFARLLVGQEIRPPFQEERAIAQHLQERPELKVLLDDQRGYPIVFFHGKPEIFVLPYQRGYSMASRYPERFVDYVLLPGTHIGPALATLHLPDMAFRHVVLEKTVGNWFLFRTIKRDEG